MQHPYRDAGIVLLVVAFIVVASTGITMLVIGERRLVQPAQCLGAPERAMALYGIQPIDHEGHLWLCGTLLGDERRVPGYFCYRMESCNGANGVK